MPAPTPGDYSGYAKPGALLRQQRGRNLAIPMSLATPHEILQEAPSLLTAGLPNTQDSLDEPTPPLAICAAAPLPPQDGMPQRPLGGVIRRFDTLLPDERPQLRFVGSQATARRCRLRTAASRSLKQRITGLSPQSADIDLEAGAVQRPVSDSMPPGEHPVGQVQQLLPGRRPAVLAVDHRLKIATQV